MSVGGYEDIRFADDPGYDDGSRARTGWGRLGDRIRLFTDRSEGRYLRALRVATLLIATLLLLIALIYLALGLYGRAHVLSAKPADVEVAGSDLVTRPTDRSAQPSETDGTRPRAQGPRWAAEVPQATRTALFTSYRQLFEPYKRAGDGRLTEQALMARLFPDAALDAFADVAMRRPAGEPNAARDSIFAMFARALDEAGRDGQTKRELSAYKAARQVQVCRTVTTERQRRVQQWDRYSIACPYWYEDNGCLVTRSITEPVSSRACRMQFPSELAGPAETMEMLRMRFLTEMGSRLSSAENDAEAVNLARAQMRQRGAQQLMEAAKYLLAFLAVMMLYIFVAVERHQRSMVRAFEQLAGNSDRRAQPHGPPAQTATPTS